MTVKLTLKQKTKLKTIECINVNFITFDKQYLVVTYNTVTTDERRRQHSYYRLNTVLAIEEY